jgi:hypothetical protein
MTPAERANLEYTYDQLYKLYEAGDIRPGEMQELQRLDDMLRPMLEAEAAQAEAQSQPMMYDPQVGVPEIGIEPEIKTMYGRARDTAVDLLPPSVVNNLFGRPASQDFLDREGLLGFTGVREATRLADAPVNAYYGNTGEAVADVGMGALGLLGLIPASRAATGPAIKTLSEGMIDVADQPIAREYFARQLKKARATHGPIGKSVDVYSPDEYAGMKMGMTPAGDAGYVVKPDGEVASVVKAKGAPIKDFAGSVLRRSEPQGGYWLNAFDTALPELYGRGGFRPVSRLPFAEDIARGDWGDEATDAFMAANSRYSGGRPDLVFMARDPATPGPVMQGRGGLLTDDYDVAVQELERELKRLGYR